MNDMCTNKLWRWLIKLILDNERGVGTEVSVFLKAGEGVVLMRRKKLEVTVGVG